MEGEAEARTRVFRQERRIQYPPPLSTVGLRPGCFGLSDRSQWSSARVSFQVAGVQKAEEAVSPAEESIDLVGLEQTEVVLLAPDEIGPGRGYKVKL